MEFETRIGRVEGDGPFRESARPPLLPIPGGRAVMLQRTTMRVTRSSWGVLLFCVVAPCLLTPVVSVVPESVYSPLGLIFATALVLLIPAVLATTYVGRHTARWILHFDDDTTVLEDRRTGIAIRLTRENARNGLYATSADNHNASLPMVIVDTESGRILVGPPKGTLATAERAEVTGAPHVIAPQRAVWDALRSAATRAPT